MYVRIHMHNCNDVMYISCAVPDVWAFPQALVHNTKLEEQHLQNVRRCNQLYLENERGFEAVFGAQDQFYNGLEDYSGRPMVAGICMIVHTHTHTRTHIHTQACAVLTITAHLLLPPTEAVLFDLALPVNVRKLTHTHAATRTISPLCPVFVFDFALPVIVRERARSLSLSLSHTHTQQRATKLSDAVYRKQKVFVL